MITRVTKPPTMTKPMRKPVNVGGKARAAQLPKTNSNRSSFAFQSSASTSQIGSSKHKTAGNMNFEPKSALGGATKPAGNRFASPKTSHSHGFGLSKTVSGQTESHLNIHGG